MRKIREYLFIIIILFFCGLLIFSWVNKYAIARLEDTRMIRAHQALYSFRPYFPDFLQWIKDLKKNGIVEFSLGYFLPAPLMFCLGDIAGFKLAHILASLTTVFFIFLILRNHFKYSFKNTLLTIVLLLTSYGFVFLSTYTVLDQFAFMFFFIFIYLYFQEKIFWAGLAYVLAIISKDPRIILASVPALATFIYFFDKKKLKDKKNWFFFAACILIFLLIQSTSQGALIDSFPFGLIRSGSASSPKLSHFFSRFRLIHLYGVFFTAPVLTITAILGLADLLKNKVLKIEKMLLLSFFSIFFIYLSAAVSGLHYIYFVFLFLALFSARYLKKASLLQSIVLCLLSGLVLFSSLQKPIYFKRPKISDLERIKIELLPYSNEGFILFHGLDWGRYFHGRRFGNVWDWEWSISTGKIGELPLYVEKNIKLVVIPQELFFVFDNWERSKDYRLVKVFDDWLFFIPVQK